MNRMERTTIAALIICAAAAATPVSAATIANPTNSYSFPYLSGSLAGGQQTQYVGETFTAPITGELVNFQFTLNTSSLQSVYGVVFAWNGTSPTTELWRSGIVPGSAGLFSFSPTNVSLTQGQTYVAFLSTYGLTTNSGLATVATCLTFGGCASNSVPNLGTLIYGNVLGRDVVFSPVLNNSQDATFSATITSPVPEPSTWAMAILGIGMIGYAMRRRQKAPTRASYTA
jgi:hypothetical protein